MARLISICNQKGGVAKTTTAIQLATGLAKRGYKVLMVDLDSQRNTTTVYRAKTDGVATIHDLLFTRGIDPMICIQHTEVGDIVAGDGLMAKDDANMNGVRESLILKKAIEPFRELYDFIVFDHNPGQGGIINNALTAADDVIIPMQTEIFSIDGAADLAERINSVKEFTNHNLRVAGVLVTFYNGRTNSAKDFVAQKEAVERVFQTKVFDSKIRRCQSLVDANNRCMSVFTYAPKRNGAKDYDSLIDEYLMEVNCYGTRQQ
jgi:chromosome partitioning protein